MAAAVRLVRTWHLQLDLQPRWTQQLHAREIHRHLEVGQEVCSDDGEGHICLQESPDEVPAASGYLHAAAAPGLYGGP